MAASARREASRQVPWITPRRGKTNSTAAARYGTSPSDTSGRARRHACVVLAAAQTLNPLVTMLRYKQLWTIEQIFRTAKHLLATRPIFHKL